jgi:hypothetical protein
MVIEISILLTSLSMWLYNDKLCSSRATHSGNNFHPGTRGFRVRTLSRLKSNFPPQKKKEKKNSALNRELSCYGFVSKEIYKACTMMSFSLQSQETFFFCKRQVGCQGKWKRTTDEDWEIRRSNLVPTDCTMVLICELTDISSWYCRHDSL